MTTETKTIQIKVYRDKNGKPTCANTEGVCQFFATRKFGSIELCMYGAFFFPLERGETRHLMPIKSCPLWGEEVTTKETS